MFTKQEVNRYNRQLLLPSFSEKHQQVLAQSTVGVCGVGGLGSIVAPYLVGAGVGTVLIVDPDTVALHNLHRQILFREDSVSQSKVTVAAQSLRMLNSDCTIVPLGVSVESLTDEQFNSVTVWVDALDALESERYLLDRCLEHHIPFIYGAASEWSGVASAGVTDKGRQAIRRILHEMSAPSAVKGILGSVAGTIAAMQVTETIKALTHIGESLDGKLFSANYLTNEQTIFSIAS